MSVSEKKNYRCSKCHQQGHNRRTCPEEKLLLGISESNSNIQTKETKKKKKKEPMECTICCFDKVQFISTSCCNQKLCRSCFNKIYDCPFCRKQIKPNKPIYRPPEPSFQELMQIVNEQSMTTALPVEIYHDSFSSIFSINNNHLDIFQQLIQRGNPNHRVRVINLF